MYDEAGAVRNRDAATCPAGSRHARRRSDAAREEIGQPPTQVGDLPHLMRARLLPLPVPPPDLPRQVALGSSVVAEPDGVEAQGVQAHEVSTKGEGEPSPSCRPRTAFVTGAVLAVDSGNTVGIAS